MNAIYVDCMYENDDKYYISIYGHMPIVMHFVKHLPYEIIQLNCTNDSGIVTAVFDPDGSNRGLPFKVWTATPDGLVVEYNVPEAVRSVVVEHVGQVLRAASPQLLLVAERRGYGPNSILPKLQQYYSPESVEVVRQYDTLLDIDWNAIRLVETC